MDNFDKCRYRYATVTDITGDGDPELILGGRIDQGKTSYALLDVWKAHKGDFRLISRYRFTGAGSTMLRVIGPLPESPGRMVIGGRLETLQDNRMKWKGFLQQMTFESGTLFPCSKPVILEKDFETRVRTIDIFKDNLIAAGFTEGKTKASTGFITIYNLNRKESNRLSFYGTGKNEIVILRAKLLAISRINRGYNRVLLYDKY